MSSNHATGSIGLRWAGRVGGCGVDHPQGFDVFGCGRMTGSGVRACHSVPVRPAPSSRRPSHRQVAVGLQIRAHVAVRIQFLRVPTPAALTARRVSV
jgi:hypothetical protein